MVHDNYTMACLICTPSAFECTYQANHSCSLYNYNIRIEAKACYNSTSHPAVSFLRESINTGLDYWNSGLLEWWTTGIVEWWAGSFLLFSL